MATVNHKQVSYEFVTGNHLIDTRRSYNYLDYPSSPDGWMSPCNGNGNYDGEKEMVEWLQREAYNLFGVKIIFYETTYDKKRDAVWGEDGDRHVISAWNMKSYFPLPKEDKTWSKFGIEGMNVFSIFISKAQFKDSTEGYRPQMGDIVQTVFDDKLYEITEVKEESPMFFQSKRYTWELIVRPLKIEQEVTVSPSLSDTPIAKYYKVDDIFDIRTDVDIEIDEGEIKYEPKPNERPNGNPFGHW